MNSYYEPEELEAKLHYYNSLPEKARRHFLALEYKSLGKGSQRYIAKAYGCSRHTIIKGGRELSSGNAELLDYRTQRKKGGGRKKKRL